MRLGPVERDLQEKMEGAFLPNFGTHWEFWKRVSQKEGGHFLYPVFHPAVGSTAGTGDSLKSQGK